MELRQYWHIVWKRVWIVVALLVVVLIGSLALRAEPAPLYQATMRFLVGVAPEARTGDYYTYDRYYTWLSSEYLADDLSEVVKGSALADDVSAYLAQGEIPITVSPGAIQGSTVAEKQHRILTLRITWGNADELAAIANAVAEDLPIRLFLALLAGVALTFLLDYLDDTVRDQAELEAMGITVLGEIPRRSRGFAFWRARER